MGLVPHIPKVEIVNHYIQTATMIAKQCSYELQGAPEPMSDRLGQVEV